MIPRRPLLFPSPARPRARRARLMSCVAPAAALALVALTVAPAAAERVRVGAGEHGGFSRLVLNMKVPSGWTGRVMEENGAPVVELQVPGVGYAFDARAVTEARRAHRVSSFSTRRRDGATVLRFGLTCACEARFSGLPGGAVKIDVHPRADGASASDAVEPLDTAAIETASTSAETAPTPAPEAASPSPSPTTRAERIALARESLLTQLRRAAEMGLVEFKDGSGPATPPAGEALRSTDAPQGAAPEEEFSDEIAERAVEAPSAETAVDAASAAAAATEAEAAPDRSILGSLILDRARARVEGRGDAASEDAEPEDVAPVEADAPTADAAPDASEPPARSDAQIDGAAPPAAPASVEPAALAACLPDEALDPADWGDPRSFSQGLSARRSAIYDQLNRPDPAAVARLMAFYLSYGFGEEARAMARAFQVDSPEITRLGHVADVVIGEPPRADSPFARPAPCAGWHGIWQAAALGEIAPEIALPALEQGRRELDFAPEPLRRLLAGRIGRAAVAAGALDRGEDLWALMQRNQDAPTIDMLLIEAELRLAEGRIVAARRALKTVMDGRSPAAPLALMRYAETLEAPQERVRAAAVADSLSDMRLQYRRSELWGALVEAEATLLARFGRLPDAMEVYAQALGHLGPQAQSARYAGMAGEIADTRRGLLDAELDRLTADPAPDALVRAIDVVGRLAPEPSADAQRLRLARILIDADAAKLAQVLLDAPFTARNVEAAALHAEAEIAKQLPEPPTPRDPEVAAVIADGLEDAADRMADGAFETGDAAAVAAQAAEQDALRAARLEALDQYLSGEPGADGPATVSPDLSAALSDADDPALRALGDIFSTPRPPPPPPGAGRAPKIENGKNLVNTLDAEIESLREMIKDE